MMIFGVGLLFLCIFIGIFCLWFCIVMVLFGLIVMLILLLKLDRVLLMVLLMILYIRWWSLWVLVELMYIFGCLWIVFSFFRILIEDVLYLYFFCVIKGFFYILDLYFCIWFFIIVNFGCNFKLFFELISWCLVELYLISVVYFVYFN